MLHGGRHRLVLIGGGFHGNVELTGRRRQDARPESAKMYRVPPTRAWWPAVAAPVERRVRLLHWQIEATSFPYRCTRRISRFLIHCSCCTDASHPEAPLFCPYRCTSGTWRPQIRSKPCTSLTCLFSNVVVIDLVSVLDFHHSHDLKCEFVRNFKLLLH